MSIETWKEKYHLDANINDINTFQKQINNELMGIIK